MRWLILILIIVPTAELALLIYSGNTLGLFPTIALILITGVGGGYLAKKQGTKAWNEFRQKMTTMETPGNSLIDGVCIFFGGILLLIPGFITDLFGVILLFKGPRNLIRPFIIRWLAKKMKSGRIVIR